MSRGKEFEKRVRQSLAKLKDCWVYRFIDVAAYSNNPSDFLAYRGNKLWLVEAKSIDQPRFPLRLISPAQYNLMMAAEQTNKNIRGIVVIWFVTLKKVIAIPIDTCYDLFYNDKVKSIKPDNLDAVEIPSITKSIYPTMDFSGVVL